MSQPNHPKEFLINHPEELESLAESFLTLVGKEKIILFKGSLGAGKTTFIKAICKKLGVCQQVNSPTFSLVNEYTYTPADSNDPGCIHHLDLYRLKNIDEAIEIGIEDYLFDDCFCFIEWPDVINDLLPPNYAEFSLYYEGKSSRKIVLLLPPQ